MLRIWFCAAVPVILPAFGRGSPGMPIVLSGWPRFTWLKRFTTSMRNSRLRLPPALKRLKSDASTFQKPGPVAAFLGRLPNVPAAGRSKAIRFDRPGIVRVFCDIHSHMSAFILVFSHPYFAVTDSQGRYHIDNVPPGNYGVIAWNEGNASEPKAVIVPDGGAAELDFALR